MPRPGPKVLGKKGEDAGSPHPLQQIQRNNLPTNAQKHKSGEFAALEGVFYGETLTTPTE